VIPERLRVEDPPSVNPGHARGTRALPATSQSIDWYHEGQSRTIEVDGVRVTVRFIGRRGRRGRIAIEAPPGARFLTLDLNEIAGAPGRSN
jgi:hypothetical protein